MATNGSAAGAKAVGAFRSGMGLKPEGQTTRPGMSLARLMPGKAGEWGPP